MANTLITPQTVASVAATIAGKDHGVAALVSRDLEAEFSQGQGATVRVRVPGVVAARTKPIFDKSTPLVTDEITEGAISVTLSAHAYSSVLLSEGDLSLGLEDYSSQVLAPQASSIVKEVERQVIAAMKATPAASGITFQPEDPARAFTAIRKKLRSNGVGAEVPLLAAVGADVYAALLDAEKDFEVGEVGKIRGFTVQESNRLAPGEIVGFIKPAFSLVVRAPIVPPGAPFGASVNEGGFALRYIRAFDASVSAERSTVSAFVGVSAMPLAVDKEDGTLELVQHGGAVRVLAA